MTLTDVGQSKAALRQELAARWAELWPGGPAALRPPHFPAAGRAAERLRRLAEYRRARQVLVLADPALLQVRVNLLADHKLLLAGTPGLKDGLVRFADQMVPLLRRSKDLRGGALRQNGRPLRLPRDLPGRVDLVVGTALAVDRQGNLLGDGRGLWDAVWAVLGLAGAVSERTLRVALVDQAQIREETLPVEAWDVGVDLVVTPQESIRCPQARRPRPSLEGLPPALASLPLLKSARDLGNG
ncbi:MAG: 5-formyltetrahydrofolate cyclo-ligase [Deltaproteobacteria bacterium]|nr:5-formyltetrahydrofolate cyclo-ligase [Deltaproteobacteria bacterium]